MTPDAIDAIAARFFAKVADVSDPDACWIWTAYCNEPSIAGVLKWGMGFTERPRFCLDGRREYANRVALFLADGVPLAVRRAAGLEAAHQCNNRKCVNARHLRWATKDENKDDRRRSGDRRRVFGMTVETS